MDSAWAWQASWDRQQEGYLPDREHRFAAMLDVVAAIAPAAPKVLDLAGGTGSISLRLLRRHPDARVTLADLDPVLLHIARHTLPATVAIRPLDLHTLEWYAGLDRDFDAIVTATALHWLPAERLAAVYADLPRLLRPGGVFINADHMPDDGLPAVSDALRAADAARLAALHATAAAVSWTAWWETVSADPVLGPLKSERDALFSIHHSQEWLPPVSWHLNALAQAGFAETGLIWRGGLDAAVLGWRG